ncbi:MAG: hypothetical protein ACYS8W_17105 [Planctomycetota bacterium]|jgi:hypothetical protein
MVQKTTGIIIALGGLALVFILLFFGFDVYLSARRGPKWKRKLLSAGIIALSMMGVTLPMTSCTSDEEPTQGQIAVTCYDMVAIEPPKSGAVELGDFLKTWKEGRKILESDRWSHPFDKAGKKNLLAALKKAEQDVSSLESKGDICKATAALLRKDLAFMISTAQSRRPSEKDRVECYKIAVITPARGGMARISERLPLLEKLLEKDKLNKELVLKVLETIERDISILEDEVNFKIFSDEEKERARETRKDAAEENQGKARRKGNFQGKTGLWFGREPGVDSWFRKRRGF